jgi:hypothetical protein
MTTAQQAARTIDRTAKIHLDARSNASACGPHPFCSIHAARI